MNRASIDVWVGLFVAAGIAAVIFLALRVSNPSSFSSNGGVEIKAQFDNIGGLKANAPVKSAGVVVGRVRDIRFDNKTYRAMVTLQLFDGYQFSKDSSAQILTLAVEDGRALRPGQNLTAAFDPARTLLFDTEGQRIR